MIRAIQKVNLESDYAKIDYQPNKEQSDKLGVLPTVHAAALEHSPSLDAVET